MSTVLSPSNVTSMLVSVAYTPILLADRKPMPPQHSRQSCSPLTLLQVAAALRPLDTRCTVLASLGFLRSVMSCSGQGRENNTRKRQ